MNHSDGNLTVKEVRALNEHYEPLGLRVCRSCRGAPLPLTTEYFYSAACRYGLNTICKKCHNARCAARAKERYHEDAGYRQRIADHQRRYRQRRVAAYFALKLRGVEQRRRRHFARILEGTTP